MSQLLAVWSHRPLIGNFAQRELKARYRKSLLGWFWSLINPLATIAVFSLVFGQFFRVPPPPAGNEDLKSFALYLFAGLVVWNLFASMVSGPMEWLAGVNDLLKKVAFPPETAIFGGALSAVVQTVIETVVLLVILIVLANASVTMVLVPYILVMALLFGLGNRSHP